MKKFVMGLIVGIGIMFAFSAYAAEVKSLVGSVIEGQFNVTLDGVQLEEPALVVNGTSYLPVRAIADAMGLEASFDSDMGVKLKKKIKADEVLIDKLAKNERALKSVTRKLEGEEHQLNHWTKELEELKSRGNVYGSSDDEYEQSKAKLEAKVKELTNNVEKLQSEKSALETEKAELEAQLESMK